MSTKRGQLDEPEAADIQGVEELPPRASAMIEAMRDIGYSLESAVADIIDNSITARASAVDVRFGWYEGRAWIGIIDDGEGMPPSVLREAMRPGTRNPLESRSKDDLGRFGLGLKTASFSQCRRLTVLTRHNGIESAARWDLDYVAETDKWTLQRPVAAELALIPCFSELGPQGTLVMWENIDRLEFDGRDERGHQQLNEQMAVVREHVARIFHRFIGGDGALVVKYKDGSFSILTSGTSFVPPKTVAAIWAIGGGGGGGGSITVINGNISTSGPSETANAGSGGGAGGVAYASF